MEIFIEEMIKKQKTATSYLIKAWAFALAAMLAFVIMFMVMPSYPDIASVLMLLVAGVIYGAYFVSSMQNVEYEYSLVNTEIDIDKITNRTRRKRLVSMSIRNLEAVGTKKNPEFERYIKNDAVEKIYACRSKADENTFFIVGNQGDRKKMLVFSPSEKIIDQIAKRNPKIQMS